MNLQTGYSVLVTLVFICVVFIFLFPLNSFIPLDRRLAGLFGATLCGIVHLMFPGVGAANIGDYVDKDVLLILIAIMGINFMVMRQPVLLAGIRKVQHLITSDPNKGIWAVSLVSFVASPFITNDGLCLLLTWPVLDAFQMVTARPSKVEESIDKFYFCLAICCSANIGSAMTYTGNPQNIIIAGHLSKYMAGGTFFGLLIVPATICCGLNTWYLNYARLKDIRKEVGEFSKHSDWEEGNSPLHAENNNDNAKPTTPIADIRASNSTQDSNPIDGNPSAVSTSCIQPAENKPISLEILPIIENDDSFKLEINLPTNSSSSSTHQTDNRLVEEHTKIIEMGSLPLFVFPVFAVLIILELSGLPLVVIFVVTAIVLVSSTLLINYYRHIIQDSHEELFNRRQHMMKYIEALFHDLDYNLIIIFIGLFIVSGSFVQTRIPAAVWGVVAGSTSTAFQTAWSVTTISIYIIFFSQLVGNVPLVYMAADQMVLLPIATQRFGWVLLAWVSTVAGNFTLCGSAANIIVAEKASRHSAGSVHIGAIKHFKVCGFLTIVCIVIGVAIITLEFIVVTEK